MATWISDLRQQYAIARTRARFKGECNVCGFAGKFLIRPESAGNLRETLDCPDCGSNSRDRLLAGVMAICLGHPSLLRDWPVDTSVVIREPSAYRGRAEVLAQKVDFRPFRYPEENLEKLADADESINHIVAADVFEHVRHDADGFREVYRVLKPGGFFFIQVPLDFSKLTHVLVQPNGEEDIYLEPPQYHDESTLVYRIYGRDLLLQLASYGFLVGYVATQVPRLGISIQDMVVCRKSTEPPPARPGDLIHIGWNFPVEELIGA